MKPHPDIHLRPLSGQERAALRESIERVGVIYPILTWGDFIIDGNHRWSICKELCIDCPTRMLHCTEDEAIAIGLEANLSAGRQMSKEEMAKVAAALHALILAGVNPEMAMEKPKPNLALGQTQLQLDYINAVRDEACQELCEAVMEGVIYPRHAYEALQYTQDVQRAAVGAVIAKQYRHLPEAIKAITKESKAGMVDELGNRVLPSMEPIWLQRQPLLSHARQLRSTIRFLRLLSKSPKNFYLFLPGDPIGLGTQLHRLIAEATPWSVCLYCECHKGKEPNPECQECGGYGMLGRQASRKAESVLSR